MAHYDLEEQEQIDSIKTWWKMYGNLVTGVVVAGSLAVIGWQGWNWHQRSHCLLYTSDAADDPLCVDLGGRRILTKKTRH